MEETTRLRAIEFEDGILKILDQRLLPHRKKYVVCKDVDDVVEAIKKMAVRGAPAIGIAAAYGMVFSKEPEKDALKLKSSRPTAVDLSNAVDFVLERIKKGKDPLEYAKKWEANVLSRMEILSEKGAFLIPNKGKILTHCNTGFLATNGYGTALGVIRKAHEEGKDIFVWATETRPRFQGALTEWELNEYGIPHKVIVDSSAGFLMKRGEVNIVIVGADRIVASGDVANKIGTYSLAVLAKENDIPFYVAAPMSSFDFSTLHGEDIKIEERSPEEVLKIGNKDIYRQGADALNLAFDITPNELITGYITEYGIFRNIGELKEYGKIYRRKVSSKKARR